MSLRRMLRRLRCALGDHDWTCAAEQGIQPTPAQTAAGMLGYLEYAQGYCRHCPARLGLMRRQP